MSSGADKAVTATLQAELKSQSTELAVLRDTIAVLEGKIAALESSLAQTASENEFLKRRLFGPRSERTGTNELQLLLGDVLADQAMLQKQLDELTAKPEANDQGAGEPSTKPKAKPKGRRKLDESKLPVVVVDITNEELAKRGRFIRWDESRQLMFERGGFKVLLQRVAQYELPTPKGCTAVAAEAPKRLVSKGMLHSSLIAWIAIEKFLKGCPHYRLEKTLCDVGDDSTRIDRGTMSRYMEELGNHLGCTIVQAMLESAKQTVSVLSTDATGALIQPVANGNKQVCKKGHFFVIVADCDHVIFEYTPEHRSDVVARLFKGFRGLLQSDASSVYDILEGGSPDIDAPIKLVGCWAHCRRYFFEAAISKHPVGIEGLTRIQGIYAADSRIGKVAPSIRKQLRKRLVAPLIDDFYEWIDLKRAQYLGRDYGSRALNYAHNQETELRRVLLDGRLPLDNTRSERALRTIVVGRKNWMFYGSDCHAHAAAAIFSVLASCRLHKLDPWRYLEEVIRVLPYWPKGRYLELSPKYWPATRARLDPKELERPAGAFNVPPALAIA